MKKYPIPKVFNPTPEEEKEIAIEIAKLLSPNKVIITKSGGKIRGKRRPIK